MYPIWTICTNPSTEPDEIFQLQGIRWRCDSVMNNSVSQNETPDGWWFLDIFHYRQGNTAVQLGTDAHDNCDTPEGREQAMTWAGRNYPGWQNAAASDRKGGRWLAHREIVQESLPKQGNDGRPDVIVPALWRPKRLPLTLRSNSCLMGAITAVTTSNTDICRIRSHFVAVSTSGDIAGNNQAPNFWAWNGGETQKARWLLPNNVSNKEFVISYNGNWREIS